MTETNGRQKLIIETETKQPKNLDLTKIQKGRMELFEAPHLLIGVTNSNTIEL